MKYLIDIKASQSGFEFFRLYLANYGGDIAENDKKNKNTSILTVTIKDETTKLSREYLDVQGSETINYGGLCPPPSSYEALKRNGSILLKRAIEVSNAPTRTITTGGQKIIRY